MSVSTATFCWCTFFASSEDDRCRLNENGDRRTSTCGRLKRTSQSPSTKACETVYVYKRRAICVDLIWAQIGTPNASKARESENLENHKQFQTQIKRYDHTKKLTAVTRVCSSSSLLPSELPLKHTHTQNLKSEVLKFLIWNHMKKNVYLQWQARAAFKRDFPSAGSWVERWPR